MNWIAIILQISESQTHLEEFSKWLLNGGNQLRLSKLLNVFMFCRYVSLTKKNNLGTSN